LLTTHAAIAFVAALAWQSHTRRTPSVLLNAFQSPLRDHVQNGPVICGPCQKQEFRGIGMRRFVCQSTVGSSSPIGLLRRAPRWSSQAHRGAPVASSLVVEPFFSFHWGSRPSVRNLASKTPYLGLNCAECQVSQFLYSLYSCTCPLPRRHEHWRDILAVYPFTLQPFGSLDYTPPLDPGGDND